MISEQQHQFSSSSTTTVEAVEPLIAEITPRCDPVDVFLRLRDLPHCIFLDSVTQDPPLGRYSFVAADPFEYIELDAGCSDQLMQLTTAITRWKSLRVKGMPPFSGGAAGLLSYELSRWFERVPSARFDEFHVPAIAIGLYDCVVAFDHLTNEAWIVSTGFPETKEASRLDRAHQRMAELQEQLMKPHVPMFDSPLKNQRNDAIRSNQMAPQYATSRHPDVTSSFDSRGFCGAVQRAIDYIYAGDLFQVNLSHRLLHPQREDSVQLYLRLREKNPAPFAGFFDTGRFQIVSASPERFLSVNDGYVEARPIKGTRRRTARPEADLYSADELQASEKDRAENVMIVDLLRNDMSRVCRADSIHVTQLCRLENYQYVQHLVSAIVGQLDVHHTPVDLIRAAFPGGSITGAPKVRAMEIISELEPTARGAYCGCLGYIGFDGSMDLSILIRTITAGGGWWQFPVGGGIVAQSNPVAEYEETWDKAEGLLRAL